MNGAKICAPMAQIWYDLCNIKILKSSNFTQIDAKTLVMDLTSIKPNSKFKGLKEY